VSRAISAHQHSVVLRMKKFELIDEVSALSGQPRTVVRAILDSTARAVRDALSQGQEVRLFGLGKICLSDRGPKRARNIHTGEPVLVPPRRVPLFRPSESIEAAAAQSRQ